MRLYAGPATQFVSDTVRNQVADKLKDAFFAYFRYNPPQGEVASWRNSLRAMSDVVTHGGLTGTGVLLEYQLPGSSKRLDCMLTGHDRQGWRGAVGGALRAGYGAQERRAVDVERLRARSGVCSSQQLSAGDIGSSCQHGEGD